MGALDYVLKPVPYFAFSQQLQKVEAQLRRRTRHYLAVPVEGGLRRLDTSRIYYIESEGHRVHFYTEEGDFAAPGALKALEEKLADWPLPAATAGIWSIWPRCRLCSRTRWRWGLMNCRSAAPSGRVFWQP